jgi:hypothetical protein
LTLRVKSILRPDLSAHSRATVVPASNLVSLDCRGKNTYKMILIFRSSPVTFLLAKRKLKGDKIASDRTSLGEALMCPNQLPRATSSKLTLHLCLNYYRFLSTYLFFAFLSLKTRVTKSSNSDNSRF